MHRVDLVDIFRADQLPDEYRGFVNFQAALDEREVSSDERVAILVVENTACYIPVFLDGEETLQELEERLRDQEAEMAEDARESIMEAMR